AASTTVEPVAPAPAKAEQVAVPEAVQAEPVKAEPAKAEAAKAEAPQAEVKQPEEDGKPRRKGWWSLGR
ncbi:MAG: hypothetical protein V7698_14585, partial [Paracoccaceae bacterium]